MQVKVSTYLAVSWYWSFSALGGGGREVDRATILDVLTPQRGSEQTKKKQKGHNDKRKEEMVKKEEELKTRNPFMVIRGGGIVVECGRCAGGERLDFLSLSLSLSLADRSTSFYHHFSLLFAAGSPGWFPHHRHADGFYFPTRFIIILER